MWCKDTNEGKDYEYYSYANSDDACHKRPLIGEVVEVSEIPLLYMLARELPLLMSWSLSNPYHCYMTC